MLKSKIETLLTKTLSPTFICVEDESNQHKGHAGYKPGEKTHFNITIVSQRFSGLTRLQRHRLVYEVLTPLFSEGVHALRLTLKSTEESNEPE